MWIAREENGAVYLYKFRPKRGLHRFLSSNDNNAFIYLGEKEVYPELTWENSPQKVEIKLIEENINVADSPSKTFPRVNEFETGASYRH